MTTSTLYLALKKKILSRFFERGFTLVEALVGIFILTIVIGGPMTIAGRAAQDVRQSKQTFIATYLAQESVELLRFKRDSLFLECGDVTTSICTPTTFAGSGGPVSEFPNESAWRLFKTQLAACFLPNGCTFDTKSIISSPLAVPTDIYDPADASCSTLYQDTSKLAQPYYLPDASDFMFFCSTHKPALAIDTGMTRVVKMTSTTTFSGPSYDSYYGDEVKVDVTIFYTFKGMKKSLMVTDYIKPRA